MQGGAVQVEHVDGSRILGIQADVVQFGSCPGKHSIFFVFSQEKYLQNIEYVYPLRFIMALLPLVSRTPSLPRTKPSKHTTRPHEPQLTAVDGGSVDAMRTRHVGAHLGV